MSRAAPFVAILLVALALRAFFFVGFGMGDDNTYIDHARWIIAGHYPPLDPLNQYAYRPLLLHSFAMGIRMFGYTDLGVVAPVLLASLVTTVLVMVFARRFFGNRVAFWSGLLFAVEPFNIISSVTMSNDVMLSCLTFASTGLFLVGHHEKHPWKSAGLLVAAGTAMVAAFLIKITLLPVLTTVACFTVVMATRAPIRRHLWFYGTFGVGLFLICLAYYFKKGDLLWQFKAELAYYNTYKPDWYEAGRINYADLMSFYPRSLFGLSGFSGYRYLDHGIFWWAFVPSAIWVSWRRPSPPALFWIASALVVFSFFEWYPQYLTPYYLPLVRQDRYMEMMIPAGAIVVGIAVDALFSARRAVAVVLLSAVVGVGLVSTSRRWVTYDDSQRDMRALAEYAKAEIAPSGTSLLVDMPAANALHFYLFNTPVKTEVIPDKTTNVCLDADCYVAVGGGRSYWWSPDLTFNPGPDRLPPNWELKREFSGQLRPWRASPLRVYYVHH